MGRLARLLGPPPLSGRTLDGFVDSLLQTFENSRAGLTQGMLESAQVEPFFRELYEKEIERLRERVGRLTHLSAPQQDELFQRVDERIRKIVLPAYARLTGAFTPRERNDFFVAPEALHGLERVGWGVLGALLGAFVVWAPFIPLWSKEWVLVFAVGGLVFPSLRRFLALRHYQGQINDLVARTDDEIWRLDLGFMTSSAAQEATLVEGGAGRAPEAERLAARLADAEPSGTRGPAERGARAKERQR